MGIPAAPLGLRAEDPTIAELLKPHGYATGQFGKNHLGDAILALTASAMIGQFLEAFKEFPPRQKAASFTIDQAVAKLGASLTSGH